jgi:hypothetical protein
MSLRKFGTGGKVEVDAQDPQGLPKEALRKEAAQEWKPEDTEELAEENEE